MIQTHSQKIDAIEELEALEVRLDYPFIDNSERAYLTYHVNQMRDDIEQFSRRTTLTVIQGGKK